MYSSFPKKNRMSSYVRRPNFLTLRVFNINYVILLFRCALAPAINPIRTLPL